MNPSRGDAKERPVLIISSDDDIQPGKAIVGLAISGTFREPLRSEEFELPWSRDGRAKTGLKKPSVVVCDWPVTLPHSEIIEVCGELSLPKLLRVIEIYQSWLSTQP